MSLVACNGIKTPGIMTCLPGTRAADMGTASPDKTNPPVTFEIVAEEGVALLGIVPAALPPNRVFLCHVQAGGWAVQQGVEVGDELLSINGMDLPQMSLMILDALLRKERPLRLSFRRSDTMAHVGSDVESQGMPMKPPTDEQLSRLRRATTKDVADFATMLETKPPSALAEGTCTTPRRRLLPEGFGSLLPFCGLTCCSHSQALCRREAAQTEFVRTTPIMPYSHAERHQRQEEQQQQHEQQQQRHQQEPQIEAPPSPANVRIKHSVQL